MIIRINKDVNEGEKILKQVQHDGYNLSSSFTALYAINPQIGGLHYWKKLIIEEQRYSFETKQEEIHFARQVKPKFFSQVEFFKLL